MTPDDPRPMSPSEARLSALNEARIAEIESLVDDDPQRCAAIAGAALDVWARFMLRRARARRESI